MEFKSHFLNPKLYNPRSETDRQIQVFGALLFNAPKWQTVLAMDDRYFHSAFMYVSFNMPFFEKTKPLKWEVFRD